MAYVPFAYDGQDPDDLLTEALARIAAALPGWTPNEAHVEYAVLSEMTRLALETRLLAADVADAIFRSYGEKLIALPALPGLPATANATFTFTDTSVRTVPAGTAVLWPSASGVPVQFVTVLAVSNTAGLLTTPAVQINASEVGTQSNGLAATSLQLVDALSFVSAVASTTTSAGGQDAETDAAYLDRLADSLKLLRRIPVLARDFSILARDVTGVHRALGLDNYQPGVNEQQTVTVTAATGGTFTVTFEGQTTAALPFNASAATVQTALVALSNIGDADVLVTAGPLGTASVTVEFVRALGDSNRTQMTTTSSLTGAGAAVSTATAREGLVAVTNAERTVSVVPVAADGTPVSTSVAAELKARLQADREVNFVVNVLSPMYTALTVTFTGQAQPGADAAVVLAAAIQGVKDYLSPTTWGGGDERPPLWRLETTVRYLDIARVIGSTAGMRHVFDVTVNAARVDVALVGAAPLPAANATVTGTVTSP